jgi:hypothetical protein
MTISDKKYCLPEELKKYFWDCEFEKLSFSKYKFFVTERILNYGNEISLKWLLGQTNQSFIAEVIKKSKNLNKKTRNYWKIILDEN